MTNVVRTIQAAAPAANLFLCRKVESVVEFYVTDVKSAASIRSVRPPVLIEPTIFVPALNLNDHARGKLINIMRKRWDNTKRALDLKSFHSEREFSGESFYAPLSHPEGIRFVFSIISSEFPEVDELDLSENLITSLDGFDRICDDDTPAFKLLNLSRNEVFYLDRYKFTTISAVSYTHLTLPTNREV